MPVRPALINVMAKAAEKAGKGLLRDFGEVEHLQISRKGPADFVSTADFKSQKILREELSKARPSFGFLMEEKDDAPDTSKASERWIVDPLDGTTNFLHGVPHWAISIAAEREGEIIAGLIYNPVSDEMFWAEKGLGAFMHSKRLRVSARKDLADCLMGVGMPFKGIEGAPQVVKQIASVMPQVSGIRRLGTCSLDLAYVAAGRFEAFWESTAIKTWDVAAGYIIVKEAGGFISPLDPKKDPVKDANIIASNAEIHEQIVKILRESFLSP